MLNTDVVASDIPLLLSRNSMKKADMTLALDFKNDAAIIFCEPIQIIVTMSGHCAIPVCWYNTILTNVTTGVKQTITLVTSDTNKSKYIALKLHKHFAQPSPQKLIKLINSAAEYLENNEELKIYIKNISVDYKICQIYRKSLARPAVGLPE